MRALALAATLLLAGGEPGGPAATPSKTFAMRCSVLHVGDGTVLTGATMVVVDGRIQAVGAGPDAPAIPEGMPVLDVGDRVVMPGIVLADTDLSGHGDGRYNVTPDFVATDGFDFVRKHPRALAGGVTTVYLSPGRNRLISGQGAVVKVWGDDLVQRVLTESSCLRINMGPSGLRAPALFEPTPTPTSDDPLLPAREQYPSARISVLPTLHRLFREALTADPQNGDPGDRHGSDEDHFAVEPLQRAARGALPLRIAAMQAADVRRALHLARTLGAPLVLEDPHEIDSVAEQAASQRAAAVFRVPVRPGRRNPGGEDRKVKDPERRPESPARAAAAGMRVALAPSATGDLADTLMVAGIAIRHGLSPAAAMRALCSDAAAILGVGDRVGTLAAGRDADFLVLSGAPFAIGTMVEKTFVGGEPAYEREAEANVLAVRAGRILTMAGRTFRDGMLIVQDGVIKAVGEDLAIPYGARVLDLKDGVMVPGFVDAYSHLGLSGEGSGIPKGKADQRVADVVRPDDPLLRRALESGLTTVLVSGTDGDAVSGRVAALKTGARTREAMVLKETAAIRFVHDAVGPDGIKPLTDAIDRGQKYIDKWAKYEKAVADFKAGVGAKPPEEEPPAQEEAAPDPISGLWEVELAEPPPFPIGIAFELKLAGQTVTGQLRLQIRDREVSGEIRNGKFVDGVLTAEMRMPMMGEATAEATVGEDTMQGTISSERQSMEFSAKRTGKPGDAAAAGTSESKSDESKEPTKPAVDESLEPLRALLEKRIPAVIRSNKAPAIESVVKWFEDKKLRYVLTGLKDAVETPDILGETRPAVLLGPEVVRRERGKTTNAAALLSDRGHAVALGTGDVAGARYLPLHAALAVRYGMDPNEALRAMTIHAARMFMLDDRIGSLERGKDADFVVFSGSPFEMTSRVQLVVVNGEVVFHGDEEGR